MTFYSVAGIIACGVSKIERSTLLLTTRDTLLVGKLTSLELLLNPLPSGTKEDLGTCAKRLHTWLNIPSHSVVGPLVLLILLLSIFTGESSCEIGNMEALYFALQDGGYSV